MPPPRTESLVQRGARALDRLLHSRRAAAATLLAAFSTLLVPLPDIPDLSRVLDVGHLPLFALIGLVVRSRFPPGGWVADAATFAIGAAIGAAGEIAQLWIPGRYASFGDELTDLVGLPLGLVAYRLMNRQRSAPS